MKVQLLPIELILEISSYLSHTDILSFRLASKSINAVLESIALSHLTLSWTCCDESCPDFTPFPLEKIKAYIKPGLTRAFQFVRHLRIEHVCGHLEARHCSLDGCLDINNEDFEGEPNVIAGLILTPWDVVEKRNKFVWYLLRKLILGEALQNLKTILINTDVTHCSSQVGHDPLEPLDNISKLLSERRRPVQTCRINTHHSYHDTVMGLASIRPFFDIPPCKELCIRGFNGIEYIRGPLQWIEQVFNLSSYLEGIDIDAPCDEKLINDFFPSPQAPPDSPSISSVPPTNVPQLRRLRLLYTGFILKPHHLVHLHGLRKLEVHSVPPPHITPRDSSACRRNTSSKLWPQFLKHRLFVPEICIAFDEMEDNLFEYLKAYPSGSLKSLTIYSRTGYLPMQGCERGLEATPKKFYADVLPVIAPWLENLVIDTDVVDDWCLGKLNEAIEGLRGCTRLRDAHVTVDPQCELERRKELVRDAFGGLFGLVSVAVAEARLGPGRVDDIRL